MPNSLGFGPRILVVEDEWLIRMEIADHLRQRGCEVLEASSGEEAVELLSNGLPRPDLVLTDIRLGGDLNGWDVAERFRQNRPEIGIIYTSGRIISPRRDVENSRFFSKPYDSEYVAETCLELAAR